ncbi:MAG: DUF4331 domain-containing protein [Myxococcota bacterium]|nr:DUF4331 domain-containing protein [Myxococcota bacterium]
MTTSRTWNAVRGLAIAALVLSTAHSSLASSHMDAPLITLDDPANTTDVYAFVTEIEGRKYLSTALAVYPFEEPGIGPNAYRFDDDVRYAIHVSLGDDVGRGRPTLSYRFRFDTEFIARNTILQSYLGVIEEIHDDAQNLRQTYSVVRKDRRDRSTKRLGRRLRVPPNNQGIVTPFYNQNDDGEQPAKDGVGSFEDLDRYTAQSVHTLDTGHIVFAGQRDDGFYADIQAIFDGLNLRTGSDVSFDSQGGFNVHTIVLNIPVEELGGDLQQVGVYATTSRREIRVIGAGADVDGFAGRFVQVGRQGNPLFAEGLVGIEDKDLYNRTRPTRDRKIFQKYALEPELAALINQFVFEADVAPENDRTDLAAIFIPDMIRVDLSTGPARLAGSGPEHPTNPDDPGFHRLGFFVEDPDQRDVLISRIQEGLGGGVLPGGWPNGRRFGDDVVDIAVTAVISDLRDPKGPVIRFADGIDNVSENDIGYNRVFPYAATPLNGRNHEHH